MFENNISENKIYSWESKITMFNCVLECHQDFMDFQIKDEEQKDVVIASNLSHTQPKKRKWKTRFFDQWIRRIKGT